MRFIKPDPWSEEWFEYWLLEHPVGSAIFAVVCVIAVWALAILIMCL